MNEIIVDVDHHLTRVGVVEDGELAEYYIEREKHRNLVGNVYRGKVQNILPGMQAAFVDIGTGKNAFLYLGDSAVDKRDLQFGAKEEKRSFSLDETSNTKLRVGQDVMVQIIKEAEGSKGPRVSMQVVIPAYFIVLVPGVDYVGVSKRIVKEHERQRLKAEVEKVRPEGMGIIVRTAAEGMVAADFEQEIKYALDAWYETVKRYKNWGQNRLIRTNTQLIYRVMRDVFVPAGDSLVINDAQWHEKICSFLTDYHPAGLDRVKLYTGETPIFDFYNIETKAVNSLARKVWLKSGGYLLIDYTEAMTVIDVNTGKFVGSKNFQDTVYQLNIEAAREIAHQVRLRDIGGIIVIDFIDMEDAANRLQVVEELREAFKKDRNKTNIVGITGLGLVEMTRKKARQRLSVQMEHVCPYCGGGGRVLQEEFVARRTIRDINRRVASGDESQLMVHVSPSVVKVLSELNTHEQVCIYPDEAIAYGEYKITSLPSA